MKYYFTTTNEGSEVVVVYARNKFVARSMLNNDCEELDVIRSSQAKKLIANGVQLIK